MLWLVWALSLWLQCYYSFIMAEEPVTVVVIPHWCEQGQVLVEGIKLPELFWDQLLIQLGYRKEKKKKEEKKKLMGFIPLRSVDAKCTLLGCEESLTNTRSLGNWDSMQFHLMYFGTRSSHPSHFRLCIIQKPRFSTAGKNLTSSGVICEHTSACSMWDLRLGLFKEMFTLGHIMVKGQCSFCYQDWDCC